MDGQVFRFRLFQGFDSLEVIHRHCCLHGAVMRCGRGWKLFSEAVEQFSLTCFNTLTPWSRNAAEYLEHKYSTNVQECVRVENRNHVHVSFIIVILWNII